MLLLLIILLYIGVCIIIVCMMRICGLSWGSKKAKEQRIKKLKENIKLMQDCIDYYGIHHKNYVDTVEMKRHWEEELKELESSKWFWF